MSFGDRFYHSSFKKQKNVKYYGYSKDPCGASATQVANMNIQQCMLRTRHRRWTCQSSFAGSHAQPCQVLDLSNRAQYFILTGVKYSKAIYNHNQSIMTGRNHRYVKTVNILTDCGSNGCTNLVHSSKLIAGYDENLLGGPCTNEGFDESFITLTRLSVLGTSIRAAALASGLWRTVRLVRLPQGLFGWHWLKWIEHQTTSQTKGWHQYSADSKQHSDHEDIWSILTLLGKTFPMMDRIDFGGDAARAVSVQAKDGSRICDTGERRNQSIIESFPSEEPWKREIRSKILVCLPRLIAIDGFDVVDEERTEKKPCAKAQLHKEEPESKNMSKDKSFEDVDLNDDMRCYVNQNSENNHPFAHCSTSSVDFDSVKFSKCGQINENTDKVPISLTSLGPLEDNQSFDRGLTSQIKGNSPCEKNEQSRSFIITDQHSKAILYQMEKIKTRPNKFMTLVKNSPISRNKFPGEDQSAVRCAEYDLSDRTNSREKNVTLRPTSPKSPLLPPSHSWGSASSGTRPPTCPTSPSWRQLPKNDNDVTKWNQPNKSRIKASRWKRRVLGMIPAASVIDNDNSDDVDLGNESPPDLL